MQPNRSHARNAEREFLDSLADWPLATARAVQERIDASRWNKLPVGEARELAIADLTRAQRSAFAQFCVDFADTEVPQ